MQHADGVSPAWPIDYDTLAPYYDRAEAMYEVHGEAGARSDRRRRASRIRFPPVPHCQGRRRHRRAAASAGTASVAAAAGPARELHLLQHLQFVPLQDSREERCRSVRGQAGDRRRPTSRCGPTRCARKLITDGSGKKIEAVEIERDGIVEARLRAARDRVVRRGELGGAAAAIGERQAPERPREFFRPRRQALHGAPGDDDAGVSSVSEERHRVPEDGGDQRLLLEGPARDTTRSARSSRRAARTA